jgi:hypothetical protein
MALTTRALESLLAAPQLATIDGFTKQSIGYRVQIRGIEDQLRIHSPPARHPPDASFTRQDAL